MIRTILRIHFLGMRRDRVVLAMTFLLPILFFSIFALVFGQQRDPTSKINVALVDEDQSDYSRALAKAFMAEGALSIRTTPDRAGTGPILTRELAEEIVKDGSVPVAVILPKGIGEARIFGGPPDPSQVQAKVQILADVSDPIAPQVVAGLLQKVSFTAAPDRMADQGMELFSKYGGGLTPQQDQALKSWKQELQSPSGGTTAAASIGLPIETVNVMQKDDGNNSLVSFYAAGVGVMFLLFSCSGAAGTLLEEEESGTLGRLIGSKLGMQGVLAGKWTFIWVMGMLQLTVMFLWGQAVFGLPLFKHVPGFVVMTFFTAAAAAGFGMLLATIARSRQQLSGISTIVILTMSALGGSMFPRFLMSETMQKMGLVTFNAWALDGYIKVFWRNAPLADLWPQVLVLSGLTVVFLALARTFARRWETL
jgi:ABC-2 type transport system permease protein